MAVSQNIVIKKCQQAGVNFWVSSQAAIELNNKLDDNLSDREINRKILNTLLKIDENSSLLFENYHSIEVRTSKDTLETFDRSRIVDSLVKETRIPRVSADEISIYVENNIRRSQAKNISSALIRELVNSALLERKLTDARANYTRVGLPVYDIKNIIEEKKTSSPSILSETFGDSVLSEYTLHKVLPRNISDAYLNSNIYIHALENFSISPYSIMNDFRFFLKNGIKTPGAITTGPAKKADVAAYHAVRVMLTSKKFVSRSVGFDFFNVFMAPYIKGKNSKEISQTCQAFLYEINNSPYYDNIFTINMDYEMPKFLKNQEAVGPGGKIVGKYGDFEKESEKFLKIFLETMELGDYSGNSFNWPSICIKHRGKIDEKLKTPRPCYFINQKDKNQSMLYNNVITGRDDSSLRAGVMQSVSINLPKIAKKNTDEKSFYDDLNEKIDLVKDVMLEKKEEMKKRIYKNNLFEFMTQMHDGEEYIKFNEFKYLMIFTGLAQASKIHLGKKIYDKECHNFAKGILRFAQRKLREYKKDLDLNMSLGEYSDTNALTRFITENKRLGIDEDISGIQSEQLEEQEINEIQKEIQPMLDGGSFYSTNSKNLLKDKDFLFLKLF